MIVLLTLQIKISFRFYVEHEIAFTI